MQNNLVPNPSKPRFLFTQNTWLFLGFFLLYLSFTNGGYFDSSDAEERFLSMRALLDTGSPFITRYWQPVPYAPIFTIGPGISALPFFGLAELVDKLQWSSTPRYQLQVRAVLVGTAFYSALWMVLVASLAQMFTPSRRRAVGIAMLTGLTTLVLPYSKSFQSENLVGLLITACVYCAFRFGQSGARKWLMWMGAALGSAITCKTELCLGALPLAAYVTAVRWRARREVSLRKLPLDYTLIALGIVMGIAVVLWHNWMRFGSPWASGYGAYSFTFSFLSGIFLQWFSSGKGLLWYSPVLLIGLYYLPRFWKQFPREAWLPFSWWLMMTCVYAKWISPAGETSIGPRFMVSYLPFGILPVVLTDWKTLPILGRWVARVLVGVSAWLAIVFSAIPFVMYHNRRWNNAPNDMLIRWKGTLENWYVPEHSPLLGYYQILGEKIFDLWGIRYGPGDSVLVIQPLWWIMLGAAITCLVLAWHRSAALEGESNVKSRTRAYWLIFLPFMIGIVMGALRVGYPKSSSLEVKWERPGWATYKTMARAIEIPDVQEHRAFHILFFQDISAEWKGQIHISEPGLYGFQLESQNYANLTIDRRTIIDHPASPDNKAQPKKSENAINLEVGWHRFKVNYKQPYNRGTIHVKWRRPGQSAWESLSTAQLK